MKRAAGLVAVMMAALTVGACAPMYGRPIFGASPMYPAARAVRPMYEPSPIGRWDAVMTLAPNAILEVLDADGTTHTARFVKASVSALAVIEDGAQTSMPRASVVRVVLLPALRHDDAVKEAAGSAAAGALTAGVGMALIPYLATGQVWIPPARFWGTGAVMGGASAIARQKQAQNPRIVYLADVNRM